MPVNYGNASGHPPPIDLLQLAKRGSLSICRPALSSFITDVTTMRAAAAELFELVERGILKIEISRTTPCTMPRMRIATSRTGIRGVDAACPESTAASLDPERLRNVGDLGALLRPRRRMAGPPGLTTCAVSPAWRRSRIGGNRLDAGADLFAQFVGHATWTEQPDQAFDLHDGKPASMAVGISGRIGALTAVHRQCLDATAWACGCRIAYDAM
jgi:hypothetical protein